MCQRCDRFPMPQQAALQCQRSGDICPSMGQKCRTGDGNSKPLEQRLAWTELIHLYPAREALSSWKTSGHMVLSVSYSEGRKLAR